jgi:hypothetical protein
VHRLDESTSKTVDALAQFRCPGDYFVVYIGYIPHVFHIKTA